MTVSKQLRVLSVLGLLAVTIPAGVARAVDPNEFKAALENHS